MILLSILIPYSKGCFNLVQINFFRNFILTYFQQYMNPKTFNFKKMMCFYYKDSCNVFKLFIVYYQKIMTKISLRSLKLSFLIVIYLIF